MRPRWARALRASPPCARIFSTPRPKLTASAALTPARRVALSCADPIAAAAPLADLPGTVLLYGGPQTQSFLYAFPEPAVGEDVAGVLAKARAIGAFAAGLLTYEWGGADGAHRRAWRQVAWPDAALRLYRARAVFEPASATAWCEGAPDAPGALERLARALGSEPLAPPAAPERVRVAPVRPRADIEAAVAETIARIRRGDLYQANISQAFEATLAPADTPFEVFRRLASASPSAYGGYLRLDADRAVVTNSPELFVRLDADARVATRPIKGTRPRGRDAETDAALAAELLASEKDRAENLMIVDLCRNDLARVCAPGSVKVPTLCALESYSNVHHLVSTVEGRLREGLGAADLLAAAYPPGSITGAPKIKAMEVIAELEGEPRGPYCGALGHVGPDGAMAFNVMIRAIALARGAGGWRARFRSGGGVVADSAPADEVDETLDKARAIVAALGGAGEDAP